MSLDHHHFEFRGCNPGGSVSKSFTFSRFLLPRNDTICTKFLCILSEYILHVEINHSLCQNSKLPNFMVILFSFSAVRWQSTNQWVTWIPTSFSIELCSRGQSCAKSKRIPLRLQRASYRAHYWVTTAQNWCRDSATEIGRKIAKTTRDVKMFNVL